MGGPRTRHQRQQAHKNRAASSGPKEKEFDGFTHHRNDTFLCSWRSRGDAFLQDLTHYRELTHGKNKKRKSPSSPVHAAAAAAVGASPSAASNNTNGVSAWTPTSPGSNSVSSNGGGTHTETNTIIKLHLLCGSWTKQTEYGDDGPSIKRRLSTILYQLHNELSALHKKIKIRYETGIICIDDDENEELLQLLLDYSASAPTPISSGGSLPSPYAISNSPMDDLPSLVLTIQQPNQKAKLPNNGQAQPSLHYRTTIRFVESWSGQGLLDYITADSENDAFDENQAEDEDESAMDMDGEGGPGENADQDIQRTIPFEFIAEFMSSIVESTSRQAKSEDKTKAIRKPEKVPSHGANVVAESHSPLTTPVKIKQEGETLSTPMDTDDSSTRGRKRTLEELSDPKREDGTSNVGMKGGLGSSSAQSAIRIFVAGDRMSVGKSSVCLGILGTLLNKMGYTADSLAYIKPATQNESPQPVQFFCEHHGIACVPIGPVVYYRGFTRAFLSGSTNSTGEMLGEVSEAVDKLAASKRVVVVDGVGFPAVGSICGTDNVSVAIASGYPAEGGVRAPPAVVVVGGSGVGSAVDAFNLNSSFFEMRQVPVIGAIFNKLDPDDSSFYSLRNCKEQVSLYFSQNEHQRAMGRAPFGFVPLGPKMTATGLAEDNEGEKAKNDMDQINLFLQSFSENVDMPNIMKAAKAVQRGIHASCSPGTTTNNVRNGIQVVSAAAKKAKTSPKQSKSREEIEQAAIKAGAAPSA